MQDPGASTVDSEARHWGLFARLFTVFFLAASAGLMVMSQAAGILQAYGSTTLFALGGTTFITGAIAAARIGGGWLYDYTVYCSASFEARRALLDEGRRCGLVVVSLEGADHVDRLGV